MVFIWEPSLATTMCDFLGWLGVRFGLLYPDTPARASRGSFLLATFFLLSVINFHAFFLGIGFGLRHAFRCVGVFFFSNFGHVIIS